VRNNSVLGHLTNLNQYLELKHGVRGLPRGLALSSTLAEYALYDFDQEIFNLESVVYYTRYVDDICIVHSKDPAQFKSIVEQKVPFELKLNLEKTQNLCIPSSNALEFLGYSITLEKPQRISVSKTKISRAKERLISSLRDFYVNKDFDLLLDRLRFLSCSVRISKAGRKVPVYSGFRHVYRFCTRELALGQMRQLDSFLHGILWSKRYSLGAKIQSLLTDDQKRLLKTVSFEKNYGGKASFVMRPDRMKKIKQAWHYG
jgi:hypothetical protein